MDDSYPRVPSHHHRRPPPAPWRDLRRMKIHPLSDTQPSRIGRTYHSRPCGNTCWSRRPHVGSNSAPDSPVSQQFSFWDGEPNCRYRNKPVLNGTEGSAPAERRAGVSGGIRRRRRKHSFSLGLEGALRLRSGQAFSGIYATEHPCGKTRVWQRFQPK